MKRLCILFIALFSLNVASSQPCLPEGITFSTQAEIDNFQTNYPNCTQIEGNVTIEESNINNLNGLSILTSIWGDLHIENNWDLNSLTGLENLTSIGGDLDIGYNAFDSLTGLDNLTSIGGKLLIGLAGTGALLTSLSGLENLTSIGGDLNIIYAYNLTSLSGLKNLTYIGGELIIYRNTALTSITGLDNLISIGNVTLINNFSLSICEAQWLCEYLSNPSGSISIGSNAAGCNSVFELANACGGTFNCLPYGNYNFCTQADIDNFQSVFPNCTELGGSVIIGGTYNSSSSDITNLNGLSLSASIGSTLNIEYTTSLTSLTGLDNLISIGGTLDITGNESLTSLMGLHNLAFVGGELEFYSNDALTNLTGLENLTSIEGYIDIFDNSSLTSLTGLENINAGSITDLMIFYNPALSTCNIKSVCDYLLRPNGVTHIFDNATGCNNKQEVKDACSIGLEESHSSENRFGIYPNPASSAITIETPATPFKNTFLTIYNINNQQLITHQITEPATVIDVSTLVSGVYIVKVTDERTVIVGKFIRQ